MPLRPLLAVFLLSALVDPVCADTGAPITAVVLYPGSATVERTASVPAGASTLEIRGLPNTFDAKTLAVRADSGIRIGQIVIREVGKDDGASPREKELKRQVRELKDQLDAIDNEVKAAGLAVAYLQKIDASAFGERGADGRQLVGVAEGIESAAARAYQRALKAEIRKRQIQEAHDRVAFELAQVQSGAKDSRVVSVRTVAERPGQLRLSYQVARAGWQPAYRAALDSNKATVELERLAQISQKTGEDWQGVKLKLSTGQPQALREPIDPQTRRVVYHKPVVVERRAAAPAPAPMAMKLSEARSADADEDGYVAPVVENAGNFASEFEVPAAVSLAADGREASVVLGKQTFAATQRVQVSPGLAKTGVLTAEFDRPSGVWLPGNIQLHRDGAYVGATHWRPEGGERFRLGFGHDELLRVAVDRKNELSGSAGFVGQRAQRKVADTYTLTNLHRLPLDVLVLEASPVSGSEEIEVERSFRPMPDEENWQERSGVAAWRRTLAPNETWKIDVGYTVTYPKDGRVTGLP